MEGLKNRIFSHLPDPSLLQDEGKLVEALNDSNCERILKLQDQSNGYTYLHLAACDNRHNAAHHLLSKGADPNTRSNKQTNEQTPLHLAANLGNEAVFQKLLLDSRADVMMLDRLGKSPLDYALKIRTKTMSDKLDTIWKEQSTRSIQHLTVLTDAIRTGQVAAILSLVNGEERRDLITFQSNSGEPVPIKSETVLNCQGLIHNVDYNQCMIPAVLTGCSVVHLACQFGQMDLLLYFMKLIPDIMSHTSAEGYTPLHILAIYNQVDLLKKLIEVIRVQRLQTLSLSESTRPEPMTANSDVMVMVAKEIIIIGDINFDVTTKTKHTPLHLAVALGNIEFVDVLLSHASFLDLNVNATDILGLTPLHLAVRVMSSDDTNEQWLQIVQMLLKAEVNVNTDALIPDSVGVYATPLTQALGMGNFDLVALLGRHGAKDTKRTALNLCLDRGFPLNVLTNLLGHIVAVRDGKYSVTWQNIRFPGEMSPDWFADALIFAHMHHHKLREMRADVIPTIESSVTILDLSGCGLRTLPIEVFYFPNLLTLAANRNHLQSLPVGGSVEGRAPAEIPWSNSLLQSGWHCLRLRTLLLKNNNLENIPECIFQLPELKKLDISQNKLKDLPCNLWIAPQLEELLCSDNDLVGLPTNTQLGLSKSLILAQKSEVETMMRSYHESFIARSTTCTVVDLNRRKVSAISESESYLDTDYTKDKRQGTFRTQVSVLKTLSEKLEERLMVHHPDLVYLNNPSDAISAQSKGLQTLMLASNSIHSLPQDFPCLCPNLKELDMSYNFLTHVPFPFIFPDSLEKLNLTGNVLTSVNCAIPPPLNAFCTLPRASSDTRLVTSVPTEAFYCEQHGSPKLRNLISLRLDKCGLKSINFYSHTNSDLSSEDLQHHRFDPEAQVDVVGAKIESLCLSENLLKEVHPSIVHLKQLVTLRISQNTDIIQVPKELGRLRKLREIHFDGLNLINPPMELLGKGTRSHDIIGYLSSLYLRAQPYHRLKLMLVGREGMGKTTLLDRLMEKGKKSEERNVFIRRVGSQHGHRLSTVGISLRDWIYTKTAGTVYNDIKTITFRTWDFGGQGEFYATHQIFLTQKALYLAVWNVSHGRKGAEELKMWLLNINARVHRAAVIIVGTHVDRLSRDDRPKLKELLQEINEFYNIPTYTPGCLHGLRWTPPLGFPCVMANVAVSCSTRDGINQLRDVIYEASTAFKEGGMDDSGPIANRGRYVLTQLYPASYLWLEDKVRNMVMDYRWTNRPPVLTTKEFMEEIFRDVNNMFVGDSAKEDLEKAVRFLCASGTLVHQEDPLLADLFFIDPQWLCDLFAHVVTIRDVNAFIHKDSGIMLKKDMEQVFRDNEFPIKWKEEYIRLMTIFEVVVEIDDSQLLIPSHVKDDSLENPFLSLSGGLHSLPPHHHIIFLPHIPSGFWVRLISRILGDLSIVSMVTTGFGAKKVKNFFGRNLPFSWCLVQRGIMLQYEDYPVLTVRELPGQQIFQVPNCSSVHYLGEENLTRKWKEMKNKPHNAIEVIVTDLYPLLMLEEVHYAYQKKDLEGLLQFPFVEFASTLDGEPQVASPPPNPLASSGTMPQVKLTLPRVILEDGQHLTTEVVITRNPRVRMHTRRKKQSTPGAVVLVEATSSTGSQSMDVIDEDGPVMRSRSRGFSSEGSFTRPKKPLPNLAKRAPSKKEQAKQSFFKNTEQSATAQPSLKEEMYDIKRAAVFSQILDHIRSIWEDWYPKLRSGMPTKTEEERVPCPFCWEDRPSGQQRILRSFSSHSEVNDGVKLLVKSTGDCEFLTPPPPTPSLEKPNLEEVPSDLVGSGTPSWEEPNHFLFNFYHYLEVAPSPSVCYCPRHHTMPSQYVIPNMTFQRVSCDIIADVKELELVSQIDKGSFATVEKRLWKQNKAGQTTRTEVAMKVMKCSGDRSKYHIMLEKELTIINDLHHVNIIRCLGVVLQPLSALLELAPMGNLRSIYLQYFSEDLLIPLRVVHKTLIDITSALEYLHSKKVIYRDLKASNVLVWRYVLPGQQLPHGDESILGDEVIHVKLSDFNISAVVPIVEKIHHPIGTPGFIAPELANYKHGLYTSKVDIFSLGSLIYELITCQQPFEREGEVSLLYKGLRPCLYKKHRVFPVLLLELMYWCWEMRVDVRPTASDVLAALESDQCMRLLMGVDIHDKMYPRSAVLWWGEPSNQEDELGPLPQQTTTDDATSRPANRPIHRLWVACGDFYSSYLTILDYDRGHFTAIQDISSGASSVLCMAVVGGTVWVGFEHGYLMVYDAATKCPSAQLWPKGRALVVQAIAHVPAFNSVYLGFGNGFVWSVPDVIAEDTVGMVTCALTPEKEFEDLTKTASTLLPVPVGGAKQYELWVGQNDRTIAILELPSLEVKDYLTISESQDSSTLPCYLSDVFVGHLVLEELSLQGQQEALESQNSFVYSSLFLGQVVIRWSANGRKDLASYNITSCSEVQQTGKVGVWINSLHGNSHHVYIGLTTGDIIILKAGTLMELATLSCHAQQVRCLVTMPTPPMNEGVADGRGKDHAHPVRLASCGLGFKSYYSPKPVDPAHKSLPEALEPAKLFLWNVSHI